jgi:hypothetical protein
MLRDIVQFQGFNVSQRLGSSEAWHIGNGCAGPYIEKNLIARNNTRTPVVQSNLDRFRRYKVGFAHDQLGATRLVEFEVKADFAVDHVALSRTHPRHVDCHTIRHNSELRAVTRQFCHFRAVNDVLARQTGNVRARPADQLALDHSRTPAGCGHCPGQILARLAAADNEKLKLLFVRQGNP